MDAEEKREFLFLKNKKLLVIILLIVIALITIFVVITRDKKYKSLEESMIATGMNYVKSGRIDIKEDSYFTLSQMGMKQIYDCKKDSGVLIKTTANGIDYEVYLICDSYKSSTMESTTSKYISLIGANPLIVESNTSFVDPGYNSNGYVVEKYTNFKNSPGLYTVTYLVYENGSLKEKVNRYVVVSNYASADAPVITLNGDSNVVLKVGSAYNEPGYVAIDPTDGVITSKVRTQSNVDINTIGEYEIVYKVTNSKGLTSTKKRLVSIIDKDLNIYAQVSLSPESETKDKVTITLKIVGKDYAYTILPNSKEMSRDVVITYDAYENDLYSFEIYDIYGNHTYKKVFIDIIDRMPPTGTCLAVSQGGVVTYTVEADDDSGIKGYSYYAGSGYTEFQSSNTFKYNMDYSNANVIIQDIAGNTTRISCQTKKMSTITSATIPTSKTIFIGNSYTIPVTITPQTGDKKEISFEIVSGDQYITLNDGVVKGIAEGIAQVRMRVADSDISQIMTIWVKKYSSIDPSKYPSTISDQCGEHAMYMKAYLNGRQLSYDELVTMHVGETIVVNLYLTKECGVVKQLTRTTADGQSNWRNYLSAESVPFVDRYDSSTFLAIDHYDWVITANKVGREIIISQTAQQSTTKFSEIKSFFRFKITVK